MQESTIKSNTYVRLYISYKHLNKSNYTGHTETE